MVALVLLVASASILLLERIFRVIWQRWWLTRKIEASLKSQGIRGPPPSFWGGNVLQTAQMINEASAKGMQGPEVSHDIVGHLMPDVQLWSKLYGKPFSTRWMHKPMITVTDPESSREVLSKQVQKFPKSEMVRSFLIEFVGQGLLSVTGDEWSHQKSVLAPSFHVQKLKAMVGIMKMCTEKLVENWKNRIPAGGTELEVTQDLGRLAADIISHTAFGSNYENGRRVFEGLEVLGDLLRKSYTYSWLPFFRLLPSRLNYQVWKRRREIDAILKSMIEERRSIAKAGVSSSFGNDLLGMILEEGSKSQRFSDKAMIDECKTFYLAGQETTSTLLGWALLLLALNPEWQEKARAEVEEHCIVDAEVLGKLKVIGMILNETLRLYPPVTQGWRDCEQDTVLNGLRIPKGTSIRIAYLMIHHDVEQWGADVHEFNPGRFAEGVVQACKHPNAFSPFSFGPRVCIGQVFALMEAKTALYILLRKFQFLPSPNYRHNPIELTTVVPKHGMPLILKPLEK